MYIVPSVSIEIELASPSMVWQSVFLQYYIVLSSLTIQIESSGPRAISFTFELEPVSIVSKVELREAGTSVVTFSNIDGSASPFFSSSPFGPYFSGPFSMILGPGSYVGDSVDAAVTDSVLFVITSAVVAYETMVSLVAFKSPNPYSFL